MNPADSDEVARYAATVRSALADLPAAERDELLEDLEDHLREVAAEGEGTLSARLGPPESYAEELRASAGLPQAGPAVRRRLDQLVDRSWARARQVRDQLEEYPWFAAAVDFLPELRPAWWMLRGYLVVVAVAALTPLGDIDGEHAVLPVILGSSVLGLFAVAGAAAGSVVLGRRPALGRRRAALILANGALAVFALAAVLSLRTGPADTVDVPAVASSGLASWNGAVTNIFPYDANGSPLHDVFLYDQDGNPLEVSSDADSGEGGGEVWYPVTADGIVMDNVFPHRRSFTDQNGNQRLFPLAPPPVTVPKLFQTVPPTPTPTPTPTIVTPPSRAPASPAPSSPASRPSASPTR